ncbi:MAG: MBL fold metallo-hydrolase [Saprospiraceae bacterium]|nr:MBL fold metallo-hydrolase [Saprospiraceae bacterium]
MRLTFLGTGTSQGIPVIGCTCSVCRSSDSRDRRLRTSALLEWPEINLLIDIGPDFRQQALEAGIKKLNAVLLTHEHADHTAGLDDIRPLNFLAGKIPFYAESRVRQDLMKRFHYAFEPHLYPGLPEIQFVDIQAGRSVMILDKKIDVFRIWHGKLGIVGFKSGGLVYITDASFIEDEVLDEIRNCKVLVLNALRKQMHHSHLHLEKALDYASQIHPEVCFITHISHQMGLHGELSAELPDQVKLAFDGLQIEVDGE